MANEQALADQTRTTLLKLAERIERAEVASPELDADIYEALGYQTIRGNTGRRPRWRYRGVGAFGYEPRWCSQRSFTASIDAALSLRPGRDWEYRLDWAHGSLPMRAEDGLMAIADLGNPRLGASAEAATEALAICSAALRARASQDTP